MSITIGALLELAARRLTDAGVPRPRLDARIMLCHVLGVGPEVILGWPERQVDEAAEERMHDLVDERTLRRPISQIIGRREFWSLDFAVTADTLTPRPESETLIETLLQVLPAKESAYRVLDLGTGTGCLLLTLLSELPAATGLGVDASAAALDVARNNADALGLADRATFREGHWGEGLAEPFNLVVCNPPYIGTGEIDDLDPEVARHEPRGALDGGVDGLDCYREILWSLGRLLAPAAWVVFEIGPGQAEPVAAMMQQVGLRVEGVQADLAGMPRCVLARSAASA
ncbi:MAG: peptide chain release factor N(5)-glutamine methyltransferase [Magnetospiraceae bacterium]